MEKQIHKINFISCLGYGSFGLVVKTINSSGIYSALKIILNNAQDNVENIKECTILKGKEHKNIVKIEKVFEIPFNLESLNKLVNMVDNDNLCDYLSDQRSKLVNLNIPFRAICIQMELCDMTLRDWLNEKTTNCYESYSQEEKKEILRDQLRIIRDLINGLQYLHQNKILHRDLKPENILLLAGDDPTWKIGDFGLSRVIHSESNFSNTLTKAVGTPIYRAPEVLYHSDLRSDLYSIGLVIWEVAQLISYSNRNKIFNKLVLNKDYSTITTDIIPGISDVIILLTKSNINERLKSVEGVNKFKSRVENKLLNINSTNGVNSTSFILMNENLGQEQRGGVSLNVNFAKILCLIVSFILILLLSINLILLMATAHILEENLPVHTIFPTCVYDGNDSIYIIGGNSKEDETYKGILRFDIPSETISHVIDLLFPLIGCSGIWFFKKILLFGGLSNLTIKYDTLEYDPINNVIRNLGKLDFAMFYTPVSLVENGTRLFLFENKLIYEYQKNHKISQKNKSLPFSVRGGSFVTSNTLAGETIFLFANDETLLIKYIVKTGQSSVLKTNFPMTALFSTAVYDGKYAYIFSVDKNDHVDIKMFNPLTEQFGPFHVDGISKFLVGSCSIYAKKYRRIYIFGGGAGEKDMPNNLGKLIWRIDFN